MEPGQNSKVNIINEKSDFEPISWRGEKLIFENAQTFVGSKTRKYWQSWQVMLIKKYPVSFNWSAAVFGPVWLGFRRMHLFALLLQLSLALLFTLITVLFFGATGASDMSHSWGLGLSLLASFVFVGCFGNAVYLSSVIKRIKKSELSSGDNGDQAVAKPYTGFKNWLFGILWAVSFLVFLFVSLIITKTIIKDMNGGGGKALFSSKQFCRDIKDISQKSQNGFEAYRGELIEKNAASGGVYYQSTYILKGFADCRIRSQRLLSSGYQAGFICTTNSLKVGRQDQAEQLAKLASSCLGYAYAKDNSAKSSPSSYLELGQIENLFALETFKMKAGNQTTLFINKYPVKGKTYKDAPRELLELKVLRKQ